MNNIKIKVYKKVPKAVPKKYYAAKDFINSRIEDSCSQEKLPAKEVIYFPCFLVSFLTVRQFFDIKA